MANDLSHNYTLKCSTCPVLSEPYGKGGMMGDKSHWENIFTTKAVDGVSWYQLHPLTSLDLIKHTGIASTGQIIDVGAGASTLVDHLLIEGFTAITVLDISPAALETAKMRLGSRATQITWIEADITDSRPPAHHFDVWHDRAVFHFLTDPDDRRQYVETLKHSVKIGGHVIIATFAPDGPTQCSNLPVMRYSPQTLHRELGDQFELIESQNETHQTPFSTEQKFIFCHFRKRRDL